MNREDILKMEPGKALDALIESEIKNRLSLTDEQWATWEDLHDEGFNHYSTDMTAAWEVVRVFPVVKIERTEIFVGNIETKVTMWSGFDHLDPAEVIAKSEPEAICKAALLAVGEDGTTHEHG